VVVNGSRAYLSQARLRYPELLAILLNVRPEVLRQRLLARNRETAEQIEQRLARNARFENAASDLHLLDNSGELEQTVQGLLKMLKSAGTAGSLCRARRQSRL